MSLKRGGYTLYGSIYDKLATFAGYKTMEDVIKGKHTENIKKALKKKYGNNLAMKIMNNINKIENKVINNEKFDNLLIDLEKDFLECMKQDIERLDNKEDIMHYMEFYRRYKATVLPYILGKDNRDRTYDTFNLDEIDDMMTDKIEEYDVLKFTSNKSLNRMAIKSALISNKDLYGGQDIYTKLNTPKDVKNTKYGYEEQNVTGKLYMEYFNDFTNDVRQMEITFDKNGIISIGEPEEYKELEYIDSARTENIYNFER